MSKTKLKKGDTVVVITGNNKDSSGIVLSIDRKKDRITVEGVNVRRSTVKPSQANPQGGLVEREMSIHISNVMLEEKHKARGNS